MNSGLEARGRQSDFGDVIDVLSELELRALESIRRESKLTRDQFLNECYYSIAGLTAASNMLNPSSFRSLSGQSRISLSIKGEKHDGQKTYFDACAEIHLGEVGLTGVSHSKGVALLNARVDRVLRHYEGATRNRGNRGPYSVFINVPSALSEISGVQRVRSVVSSVLSAIEGS